jgi:hypothetical protein
VIFAGLRDLLLVIVIATSFVLRRSSSCCTAYVQRGREIALGTAPPVFAS